MGSQPDIRTDYFTVEGDNAYAGRHLLLDFWGAKNLTDGAAIIASLEAGAKAAGATVLHSHIHVFSPAGGVSGVVVLAESHITIHTWPERDYAAIDIFMCGACNPEDAIENMTSVMSPTRIVKSLHRRGENSV